MAEVRLGHTATVTIWLATSVAEVVSCQQVVEVPVITNISLTQGAGFIYGSS